MTAHGVCQGCGAEHAQERLALEKLARLQQRHKQAKKTIEALRRQLADALERVQGLEARLQHRSAVADKAVLELKSTTALLSLARDPDAAAERLGDCHGW